MHMQVNWKTRIFSRRSELIRIHLALVDTTSSDYFICIREKCFLFRRFCSSETKALLMYQANWWALKLKANALAKTSLIKHGANFRGFRNRPNNCHLQPWMPPELRREIIIICCLGFFWHAIQKTFANALYEFSYLERFLQSHGNFVFVPCVLWLCHMLVSKEKKFSGFFFCSVCCCLARY